MAATVKRDAATIAGGRAKGRAKAIVKAPAAKAKAPAPASASLAMPGREAPGQGAAFREVSSEHMTALARALMPIDPTVRANAVIKVLAWIEEWEL